MASNPSKLSRFWRELKRRRVIHVITVYASATFVLIELVSNLTEPLNLPPNLATILIIVLAVGFPLAVILSWLYDLTGEGVERTLPLEQAVEVKKKPVPNAWRIATIVSFVIIIGLITLNIVGGPRELRAGDIQSLLILPFDNFTGDEDLDYVAAGMHSSLIGDMGKISGLRVISKTTARMFENQDMSLPDIASELNADAVVEPTVMCYGDSVCIQVRVVTPYPEEKQIWVGDYKEDKTKILNLYNRVTKQIAEEVKVKLTSKEEENLTESRTINKEAYDYYLQGLYYWDQFTPEALQLALEYFNKAIEADPEWAEPYAGIAYFWIAMHQFSFAPSSVTVPNMYKYMNKAIELDPNSSFVHYVNGLVYGWTSWDWDKAEAEFLTVLELTPNDAFGHMYYAHFLSCMGRKKEAFSHCRIALDLDPLNPMIQVLSTSVLIDEGDYEEVISIIKKVLAVVPEHPVAIGNLAALYAIMEDYEKSLDYWTIALHIEEDVKDSILKVLDSEGREAAYTFFADHLKETTGDYYPMELAQLYTLAGNDSLGLYWYEEGFARRHPMMPYINTAFSKAGPLKIKNPRFDSILIKMNIPVSK